VHNSRVPEGGVDYVDLPIYHDELSRALNFTVSDLQENRSGRLSTSQQSNWLRIVTIAIVKSVVILILACVCVAAWLAVGVTTVIGLVPLILAALFLAWTGIFAWYMPPVWRDAKAGLVSSVEGFVTQVEGERSIRTGYMSIPIWTYYWVVDGGQRFWVSGQAYPVLTPARHRLYFLPTSRRLVAAEPIS